MRTNNEVFMAPTLKDYHRPSSTEDAEALLRRPTPTVCLNTSPRPPLDPYHGAEEVVDCTNLNLDYVTLGDGVIHLGSQTRLQTLVEHQALQESAAALIAQAARLASHAGLRRISTIGGVISAEDGPPELRLALLVFGASVMVGSSRRSVLLSNYQPAPKDMVIEVSFSSPSDQARGSIARVSRSPMDEAIVAAVAIAQPDLARVAVAGASARWQLKSLEGTLDDKRIEQVAQSIADEAQPHGDYRGSADYRREMGKVLAARALSDALRRMT